VGGSHSSYSFGPARKELVLCLTAALCSGPGGKGTSPLHDIVKTDLGYEMLCLRRFGQCLDCLSCLP
jgi:hypothetical protein